MVFYRKYRPQKIDDLDSLSVRETLFAVLKKEIPHAFLFTGPKGLGKTSTARIVAKVVNCETIHKSNKDTKSKDVKLNSKTTGIADSNQLEPCNECDQCRSITNGTNVDVLEIDAASNRGIDEIRELKEKIRLAPVSAIRKVYIIDEVHMLTTEAFNALLKTLEEPPDHAMFILCTTEAHKVPETIVSRCFQIQFKPATEDELVRSFKRIVEGENLKITDEALKYIAQLSDRGFRDGVKILEEVSLQATNEDIISKEFLEKTYKTSIINQQVVSFVSFLHERNTQKSLEIIQEITGQGIDIKHFITRFLEALHELLLHNVHVGESNKNPDIALEFTTGEIMQLVMLFSSATTDMKNAVLPQLPVELAVIEWCEESKKNTNQTIPVSNQQKEPFHSTVSTNSSSVSELRRQVGTIKKLKAMYGSPISKQNESDEDIPVPNSTVELLQTNGDGPVTAEWLDLFWKSMIDEMKKYNHTVAGVLRGCSIKSFEDQKLIINTAYKFHKERLDDLKNRESLLKISKLLTGKDVEIQVELRK